MSDKAKSVSRWTFENLMDYYQKQFSGICVDWEIDPEGYLKQEEKVATELASVLIDKLNRLNDKLRAFDKVKGSEVEELQKAPFQVNECWPSSEDDVRDYDEDVEEEIMSTEQATKLAKQDKKREKEMKRRNKIVAKQEKKRKEIRKTGRGLEPGHAVVSCPDCGCKLLMGIDWLEHR